MYSYRRFQTGLEGIELRLHYIHCVPIFLSVLLLSSCGYIAGDHGYFRNRTMDYQKSVEGKKLEVAPPHRAIEDALPIPNINQKVVGFKPRDFDDVPRPRLLVAYADDGRLFLRRQPDLTQILVRANEALFWQSIKSYYVEHALPLAEIDETHFVLQTQWLRNNQLGKAPGIFKRTGRFFSGLMFGYPYRRFHFELAQSSAEDVGVIAVNVFVKKENFWFRPAEQQIKETSRLLTALPPKVLAEEGWHPVKTKDAISESALQSVIGYLSEQDFDKTKFAKVSSKPVPKRIFLSKDGNGFPQLVLELGFAEVWDRTGKALERNKVNVQDKNRSLGTYYIALGSRGLVGGNEQVKYELRLTKGEGKVLIFLQKSDEKLAPVDVAEKMLESLRKTVEKQLNNL